MNTTKCLEDLKTEEEFHSYMNEMYGFDAAIIDTIGDPNYWGEPITDVDKYMNNFRQEIKKISEEDLY